MLGAISKWWLQRIAGANGRSLATNTALRRTSATPFLSKIRFGSSGMENSHENICLFGVHFCWYGADAILVCERACFCGSRTASGERLNCSAMTAAHRRLPFGTRVRVCHSGCVTVRINDRGPFVRGRDIDLSPAAARAIGLSSTGRVTLSRL